MHNWSLAFGPDEYAQATAGVSPFQHFWSLAVEEQFYIVVPLAMILAGLIARRLRWSARRAVVLLLVVVGVLSLGWSVVYTATSPDAAYFVTTTRAWELALGGIVAILLPRLRLSSVVSVVVGFIGLAAVVVAGLTFTIEQGFPGWIALLPTLGTAAMIVAGSATTRPVGVTSLLATRPFVRVGDISYSLYLWHWPVIVFALALAGTPTLGLPAVIVVVIVSLVLAALSTRFVERPFRRPRALASEGVSARRRHGRPRPRVARTFVLGGVLLSMSVTAAVVPLVYLDARTSQAPTVIGAQHPGALVFDGAIAVTGAAIVPDPLVAKDDFPIVYRDGCIDQDITEPSTPPGTCRYGVVGASRSIVLVGDSHAAVLSTPLQQIAEDDGDRFTAMVRDGCPFNVRPIEDGGVPIAACGQQNERTRDLILDEKPDLVVVSAMTLCGYEHALEWGWPNFDEAVAGYRDTLRPILAAGIRVAVVHDTPYMPFVAPDCVSEHGADSASCEMPRKKLDAQPDPLVTAASGLPGVTVVDLTDEICQTEDCRAVEGNVLVYRDNHLTDTYARSLVGYLRTGLDLR